MPSGKKILIASSGASSLNGFRLPLIKYWRELGHEVVATACEDSVATHAVLEAIGVRFVPVPVGRATLNPFADVSLVLRWTRLLRRERPDVVFLFQQKSVIYGGLASRLAGMSRVFAMVTGLGYAFTPAPGLKHRLVNAVASALYRAAVKGFAGMIFQNPDDMNFIREKFLKRDCVPLKRVYGSGVDLEAFPFVPESEASTFLFVGRLVADKGVREYVEAGKLLATRGLRAEMRILGGLDVNPSAITKSEIDAWARQGACRWLGKTKDVRPMLRAASIFVLPSYYGEGTPRSALEAMATGRPIVVANTPGCREVVFFENVCRRWDAGTTKFVEMSRPVKPREFTNEILMGDNGFLVPAKNATDLAVALAFYLENPEFIPTHGRESRRLAEKYYDVRHVNREISEFISA